jgi:predicted component of type VI protein secretion system
MPVRLVALDEGADIPLDREMLVVGRHPQCDARLDSIRVSRRHCCMTPDHGEIIVKDLGSTNGIRINGQRVEKGRLRPGDELSIAHIRYRFEDGQGQELTLAEPLAERNGAHSSHPHAPSFRIRAGSQTPAGGHAILPHGLIANGPNDEDNPLAAAVREMLPAMMPAGVAEKCRIQVIVQMPHEVDAEHASVEDAEECPPDSSL